MLLRCSFQLSHKGRPVKLHLWDVAGSQLHAQPCHHALIGQGAVGVMYVMDVTSRESLQAVDDWDQALSKVGCCGAVCLANDEGFCKIITKSKTEPPHVRDGTPWAQNGTPYSDVMWCLANDEGFSRAEV